MRTSGRLLIGLIVVLTAVTAVAEGDTLQRANQLIQNGSHDEAIELIDNYLKANKDDAVALVALANAYHSKGDYDKAIEINRLAAATPWAAATARYNEACALSLLGRADDANRALHQAMDAGFLDYDLIATDSDLDNLRAKHTIVLPGTGLKLGLDISEVAEFLGDPVGIIVQNLDRATRRDPDKRIARSERTSRQDRRATKRHRRDRTRSRHL